MEKKKASVLSICRRMLIFIFYPALSIIWYKICKKDKEDTYAEGFVICGVIGTLGLIGFVIMWFLPMSEKIFVVFPASTFYAVGGIHQLNLIMKKKSLKSQKGAPV